MNRKPVKAAAALTPEIPAPSDETALALLPLALAKGLGKPERVAAGKYQLRGVATIAVDCWAEQKPGHEASGPFPAKDVLAVALGLAVPEMEALQSVLQRAAAKVFAVADGTGREPDTSRVDFALEQVKAAARESLGTQQVAGASSVTGDVRILEFRRAA
jgi:hypothetical protein